MGRPALSMGGTFGWLLYYKEILKRSLCSSPAYVHILLAGSSYRHMAAATAIWTTIAIFADTRTQLLQPSNTAQQHGSPGLLQAFGPRQGLLRYPGSWTETFPHFSASPV